MLPALRHRTLLSILGVALAVTPGLAVSAVAGGQSTSPELLPDLRQEAPSQVAVRRVGGHVVLAFRSAVANVGRGPLVMTGRRVRGERLMTVTQQVHRADGSVSQVPIVSRMTYQPGGHRHWHLQGFERFSLHNASTGRLVSVSRKVGFCLGSRYRVTPPVPGTPGTPAYSHNCGPHMPGLMTMRMGIDVGYVDDYLAMVEFQYIDITQVRSGTYLLAHQADPGHRLRVGNRVDDTAYAWIRLYPPAAPHALPRVAVVGRCAGGPASTCPAPLGV